MLTIEIKPCLIETCQSERRKEYKKDYYQKRKSLLHCLINKANGLENVCISM